MSAPTCSGLTASWCPLHGDCTCPRHGDAENPETSEGMRGEVIGGAMEDPCCPLHAPSSGHGGVDLDALREEHCYVTSVDGCCHCGDCECDGIGCIAGIDPDDESDYEAMENLHELLRQGQAWRVMHRLIHAGASLLDAYVLSAGELMRASNQSPPAAGSGS